MANTQRHVFLYCTDSDIAELLSKAIGLKDEDGMEVYDITEEPFKSAKPKKWKPAIENLQSETVRRCQVLESMRNAKQPSYKKWTVKFFTEWLVEHPLVDEREIATVLGHVKTFKESLRGKVEKPSQVQWRSGLAYLRLLHCFLDFESHRAGFLRYLHVKNREQLDGRNSPMRPDTVFELIAKKMNDDAYVPKKTCFPKFAP